VTLSLAGATFASFLHAPVQQHREAGQPFGESRTGTPANGCVLHRRIPQFDSFLNNLEEVCMKSRRRWLLSLGGAAALTIACAQSDAGITTSVKTQLMADDLVKARRIDVDTRDRVVTLSGEVRTAEEEAQALSIARNTKGVANVVDQLTLVPESEPVPTTGIGTVPIEPGVPAPRTDAGITSEVKTRLLADPDTSGLRIDVDTNNYVVTLTGTVKSQSEKAESLQIARQVEGVTNVVDRLKVERP
jgi:hyperosmotically inducible protein